MSATFHPEGYDAVIVGGGIVGSAIAYGLEQRGQRVAVLDEGDHVQRAARANFGLVWLQTKGDGLPAYMHWTKRSTQQWPGLAHELRERTGIDVELRQRGGVVFCLGDVEFEARRRKVARLREQADVFDTEMLDRAALERLMPAARLGPAVTGASFCPYDGDCNPLLLLKALHTALRQGGVHYRPDAPARNIEYREGRFVVNTPEGLIESGRVVLAAGHGTAALAHSLGLPAPLRAERGQILVTERLAPFMPLPGSGVRQTADGTVLIGSTKEDVGFDDGTTVPQGARMAAKALQVFPHLKRARLNRTWGGIRVLTPDNHPVYAESERCPGAFVAICHSGVTLAAAHATDFADSVARGRLDPFLDAFHARRFDIRQAA